MIYLAFIFFIIAMLSVLSFIFLWIDEIKLLKLKLERHEKLLKEKFSDEYRDLITQEEKNFFKKKYGGKE